MTIGLQITDGTTTVDLNDGSYFEVEELDLGYGAISSETVSGSVRLYIDGTKAQIQTELASLQKLLQQVVDYSGESMGGALVTASDKPVYINYRTDSGETYYRSELKSASISIENKSIEVLNFDCGGIEIIVDFTRMNWWEGAEAQIAISTLTETDVTTAATVYNPCNLYNGTTIAFVSGTKKITDTANGLASFKTGQTIKITRSTSNDGTYTIATGGVAGEIVVNEALVDEAATADVIITSQPANYIDIGSADVAGDLPAATRLEITNTTNDTDGIRYIWIGQNVINPTTHVHIYEAEDATGETPVESAVSNGAYVTNAVNSGVETQILLWPLSVAALNAAAGRWFKIIVRIFDLATVAVAFKYRFRLEVGGVALWSGPLTLPDISYQIFNRDLLTFQLPPSLSGLTGFGALDLTMRVYQDTGSAQNNKIDFIQITPVDGYRYLECIMGECEYNRRVVDDGISKMLYEDDGSGTVKRPAFVGVGSPIMLQPGKAQRLYFLNESNGNGPATAQTIGIKLYYRPRRLTI